MTTYEIFWSITFGAVVIGLVVLYIRNNRGSAFDGVEDTRPNVPDEPPKNDDQVE